MANFRYDPMKCQKMVKLSESPDPGFCDMNGGLVVVRSIINQMSIADLFNSSDISDFQEIC